MVPVFEKLKQEWREEGYKEGYAEGYKEGYAEGYKEGYDEERLKTSRVNLSFLICGLKKQNKPEEVIVDMLVNVFRFSPQAAEERIRQTRIE